MIDKIVTLALEEDTALGDITSENIFSIKDKAAARLVAKQDLILCGVNLAKEIFEYVDNKLVFKTKFNDGDKIKKGICKPVEVKFMQSEAFLLWRDIAVMRGASPGQQKPVTVISNEVQRKFFFGQTEDFETIKALKGKKYE